MSEGVPVFGAASMGALRAAELAQLRHARRRPHFRGVPRRRPRGRRRGGGRARAGRDRLPRGVGGDGQHPRDARARRSERRARAPGRGARSKASPKPCSSPIAIGRRCSRARPRRASPIPRLAALGDWLPQGRVDQKRLDALEMLAAMRETPAAGRAGAVELSFRMDVSLGRVRRAVRRRSASAPSPLGQLILDELRLEGPDAYAARRGEGAVAHARGERRGAAGGGFARRGASDAGADSREQFGLYARADLDRWMAANDLDSGCARGADRGRGGPRGAARRGRDARSIRAFSTNCALAAPMPVSRTGR